MKHVAVIGGGVVGLSTASALLASGFEVSLIERESAVAQGASHANGGQLSYRYVSPLADAGVPLKALGWMCKQDSPQQFRVEFSLQQWSWIARFLVHCTAHANRITTDRLLRLGRLSQDTFSAVSMALPAADIALRTPGKLVIYRSPGELAKAAASARNNGEAGSGEVSLLSPSECVTLEPALADAKRLLVGGVFTRNEAVADCQKFCHELLARLNRESNFTLITSSAASSLVLRQNRLVAVQIGQREIAVTDAVIAAGLGSVDLAASVGLRLPIYPIRDIAFRPPSDRVTARQILASPTLNKRSFTRASASNYG